MDSNKAHFIELAKKYEALSEEMKTCKEAMVKVMTEIGEGKFVQDPSDMTVYQIVIPQGRYVYFDPITYIRTRKVNEDRGELSIKKAEEAGFLLPHLKK